ALGHLCAVDGAERAEVERETFCWPPGGVGVRDRTQGAGVVRRHRVTEPEAAGQPPFAAVIAEVGAEPVDAEAAFRRASGAVVGVRATAAAGSSRLGRLEA